MFRLKRFTALLCSGVLTASLGAGYLPAAAVRAEDSAIQFTVSGASGAPGETVPVAVSVRNSGAGFSAAGITLTYPKELKVDYSAGYVPKYTAGELTKDCEQWCMVNPEAYQIGYALVSQQNITADGVLITLPFILPEQAADGDKFEIQISVDEVYNIKRESVKAEGVSGSLTAEVKVPATTTAAPVTTTAAPVTTTAAPVTTTAAPVTTTAAPVTTTAAPVTTTAAPVTTTAAPVTTTVITTTTTAAPVTTTVITTTTAAPLADVRIRKQDQDAIPVRGATLSLTGLTVKGETIYFPADSIEIGDENNILSASGEALIWLSSEETPIIHNLRDGSYTLHEMEAPSGYQKAGDLTFLVSGGKLTAIGSRRVSADEIIVMVDRRNPVVTTVATTTTTTTTTTTITTTTTTTTTAPVTTTTVITTTAAPVTTAAVTTSAPQETVAYRYGFDTWGFLNTVQNVGKMDSNSKQYLYYLTDEDRDLLYRKLSNIEIEKIGSKLGTRTRGACFGMATTSILQAYGYFKAEDFFENTPNIGAVTSKQVQSSDQLKSAINYYHMLQFSKAVVQRTHAMERMAEDVKLKMLIDAVKAGRPTLVGYSFNKEDGSRAGHAVVAYGIKTGEQTLIWLNANERKQFDTEILIYNNDTPNNSSIYNLFINTSTWEWCIQMTDKQDALDKEAIMNLSSHHAGNIALIIDDVELLNYHGKFSGNETYQFDENAPYYASMNLRMSAANYRLRAAEDPYDGSFNAGSEDPDIRVSASFYGDEPEQVDESSMNCNSSYHIDLTTPDRADLSMEYQNCLLQVQAAAAQQVTVSPKSRIALEGSKGSYTLSMVIDEGYHETDWYKLTVTGQDGGDLLLTNYPEGKGFLLTGSALKNITVQANNHVNSAQAKFNTSYQKVLIYEIDEKTIGIKADADGDGTFEKDIYKPEYAFLGDLDGDGEATATDAQLVLTAYTEALASGQQELTGEKFTAADVDGDGEITSADAQYILNYFVANNVAGSPIGWSELIKS